MNTLKEVKKTIVEMTHRANVSHVGSALSVVDILYVLYNRVSNISLENIDDANRDIIILSKGHSSAALYSVLYHKGLIEKEYIDKYSIDDGLLPCHIDKEKSPFFEISSGSLGHGPSVGVGFALAKKINKEEGKVFIICGDGECNEGSVWEALMFISSYKLNNIVFIVDFNNLQGFGSTQSVINLNNIEERLSSFGFDVLSIDGHNLDELENSFKYKSDKPVAVVAHTEKGKGVSFMENRLEWHYKSPNKDELSIAIKEIEEKYS